MGSISRGFNMPVPRDWKPLGKKQKNEGLTCEVTKAKVPPILQASTLNLPVAASHVAGVDALRRKCAYGSDQLLLGINSLLRTMQKYRSTQASDAIYTDCQHNANGDSQIYIPLVTQYCNNIACYSKHPVPYDMVISVMRVTAR